MAKKATLTTCNGGHLGDDPQDKKRDGIQTDVAPLLPTGVNGEEAEEVQDNKGEEDEQDDGHVLIVPGTIERGM